MERYKRKARMILSIVALVLFSGCSDIQSHMSPIGYEVYDNSNRFVYGSHYIDSANDILNACKQYQQDKLTEVYLKCVDNVKVEDQAWFVDACKDNAIDLVCVNNVKFYEDMLENENKQEEEE